MSDAGSAVSPASSSKGGLLRILGLGFGIAVTIGGTIGVSIFRLPGPIAALLGVPWLVLLVWLLGGLYTLLSANYTAELATMLPKVGGPYVYAHRAYGPFIGFVVGWTSWLGVMAALAFLSIALGEYVVALLPVGAFEHPTLVALIILCCLAVLNGLGLRAGSRVQKLTSLVKAAMLIGFIAACFIYGNYRHALALIAPLPATTSLWSIITALALSFQLVLGAYGGWNTVTYFSEEDTNPAKNIPRSLKYGTLLIMGLYLLVNLALVYVLPIGIMADADLAAADALRMVLGERSAQLLTVVAVVSILGIINAVLMFVPRVLLALGRDGLFTSKATYVNKGGTPTFGLAISVLTAIVFIALGSFETLLAIYAFYAVVNNSLLIGALFLLRKREPELERPFKTWAYPYAPVLLLVISILLCIAYLVSDTRHSLYAIATVALSYPMYRLIKREQ
jgi:APA family basic amino acid/polyamine antiporter